MGWAARGPGTSLHPWAMASCPCTSPKLHVCAGGAGPQAVRQLGRGSHADCPALIREEQNTAHGPSLGTDCLCSLPASLDCNRAFLFRLCLPLFQGLGWPLCPEEGDSWWQWSRQRCRDEAGPSWRCQSQAGEREGDPSVLSQGPGSGYWSQSAWALVPALPLALWLGGVIWERGL